MPPHIKPTDSDPIKRPPNLREAGQPKRQEQAIRVVDTSEQSRCMQHELSSTFPQELDLKDLHHSGPAAPYLILPSLINWMSCSIHWISCSITNFAISFIIYALADHLPNIKIDASCGRGQNSILKEDAELLKIIAAAEHRLPRSDKLEGTHVGDLHLADVKPFIASIIAADLVHKYSDKPSDQIAGHLFLDMITVATNYAITYEKYRSPDMLEVYNKCQAKQEYACVLMQEPDSKSVRPYTQNETTNSCRYTSNFLPFYCPPPPKKPRLCTQTSMPATYEEVKKLLSASEEMCYNINCMLEQVILKMPSCYQEKCSRIHIEAQTLKSFDPEDKSEHEESGIRYRVTDHSILLVKLLLQEKGQSIQIPYTLDPAMGFLGGKGKFQLISSNYKREEDNNDVLWFVEVEESNGEKTIELAPHRLVKACGIFPEQNVLRTFHPGLI